MDVSVVTLLDRDLLQRVSIAQVGRRFGQISSSGWISGVGAVTTGMAISPNERLVESNKKTTFSKTIIICI